MPVTWPKVIEANRKLINVLMQNKCRSRNWLLALLVVLLSASDQIIGAATTGLPTTDGSVISSKENDETANDDDAIDYQRDVRPILSDRCFACHGPDRNYREADLRLDDLSAAIDLLSPGDPESSELLKRITTSDADLQMPPPSAKIELSAAEIDVIRRWIKQGATWQPHWSLIPPVPQVVPEFPDAWTDQLDQITPSVNAIDHFIADRLHRAELEFSTVASQEQLLRRLTLDLTGLTPTVEELDAFLNDPADDAYERAIDRLLASSAYGERMATWWLDLARYSDTYGYQVDRDRFVWPWRDWVIDAFNQNQPFDQFTIEQLAGDLLPNATDRQVLATTFNRLHPQKVEGGSVEEEFRVEYVADRVHTVSMAFMGLTFECARCHDHKFDSLSIDEYYQMFAFFNNVDESGLYSFFDAAAVPTPAMTLMDEGQRQTLAELQSKQTQAEMNRDKYFHTTDSDDVYSEFFQWLRETETRASLASEPVVGMIYEIDPATIAVGDNRRGKIHSQEPDSGSAEVVADANVLDRVSQTQSNKDPVDEDLTVEVRTQPTDSENAIIQFTGDDEIAVPAGRFSREQPFSISTRIWIPPQPAGDTIDRNVIFHCSRAWTDSASRGYQLLIEKGRLSVALIHFWPGNAICVQTTDVVPTDRWLTVTITYDGSSRAAGLKIYLNGECQELEIIRDGLTRTILGSGTDRLVLGARFRDRGFTDGKLASLQIFDRCLTPIEVRQLFDGSSLTDSLKTPDESLHPHLRNELKGYYRSVIDPQAKQLAAELRQCKTDLNAFYDRLPAIMVMRESPGVRDTYVLDRGAYDSPTSRVQPNVPAILPPIDMSAGRNSDRSPNRLDLAKWLVAPQHPLTSRVIVNQLWQNMMGNGLVRTPEDFGHQSKPPTHPELLDWLALDLQRDWDLKRCLKQMAMSLTYRQSSQATLATRQRDPNNDLWGRSLSHPLSAEMLRDHVLRQSGLLVDKIGGPPVRPYDLELAFAPLARSSGSGLYRRSVYTYWKRTAVSPAMIVLDGPTRDVCQVKRAQTSSPLQGLVLLNGTQFVEAARKLSERWMKTHAKNPNEMIRVLFRALTSRRPNEAETNILLRLYETEINRFETDSSAAEELLSVGESPISTDDQAELAAWTTVTLTIMNFDESLTKR